LHAAPKTRTAQDTAKGIGAKPAAHRKGKKANEVPQVDGEDGGEAAGDDIDSNFSSTLTRSAKGKAMEIVPADVVTTKYLVRIHY
jgi:hypothetical protein